jgi:predicted dehydrogenase
MAAKLKMGLVGVGTGANLIMNGVNEVSNFVEPLYVCSRNFERAKSFAKRWNIEALKSYDEMLDKELDFVAISTPHYLHAPQALQALRKRKHVLVDKPLATNLSDADSVIDEAKKRKLKLGVILQTRFSDAIKVAKEAIGKGKLGKLVLAEASVKWWRDESYYSESSWRGKRELEGGGVLINQAIHTIDNLIWLVGMPKFVKALSSTLIHDIDVEDTSVVIFEFENGGFGVLVAGTSIKPGFSTKLALHGSLGSIVIEGEEIKHWSIPHSLPELEEVNYEAWKKPEAIPSRNHALLIKDFCEAIKKDREPLVDGKEGRKSLEFIQAVYLSAKELKDVTLPLI